MQVFAILFCLLLVFWIQRDIYRRKWDQNLEADVRFQKRAVLEDELIKVDVTVRNGKRLPLPALSVNFNLPHQFSEYNSKQKNLTDTYNRSELFTLYSYQAITRTLTFRCRQRGCYVLRELMLDSSSLFMDRVDTGSKLLDRQIMVYPKCVNMRNFVKNFQNLFGEILVNDFYNEDVFLIRGVREYQPFDSQRTINWKATAKLGSLMVNNYEYTDSRRVVIFLNLTKNQLSDDPEIAEESIRLAKTWCQNLDKYGIESDLYTNGRGEGEEGCLTVEKDNITKKYMTHVNETLAKIVSCQGENDFFALYREQIERHLRDCFMIFISADSRESFQSGLLALKDQTDKFVWVLPKSSRSNHRIRPELHNNLVAWNIYWRKEEHNEIINV